MTTLDLRATPERQIRDFRRSGLLGLRVLGCYRYKGPHPPLPMHRHPGMIEICFLHRGSQRYEVEGKFYEMRGGDMFITLPGERHSTGPSPEDRGVLYWLILKSGWSEGGFLGLSKPDSETLIHELLAVQSRLFRAPRNTRRVLDSLLVETATEDDHLWSLSTRTRLVEFLLQVCRASRESIRSTAAEWLAPVLKHMVDNLGANLQVPDFAEVAGISLARFKARFRELVGKSPAEHYLLLKIEEAKRRISSTSQPVTRIAMDLGFGSSQSFATSFRRMTGVVPSSLRSRQASVQKLALPAPRCVSI